MKAIFISRAIIGDMTERRRTRFTGQGLSTAQVRGVKRRSDGKGMWIELVSPALKGLEPGAQLAVNGACLQVSRSEATVVTVHVTTDQLRRSVLASLNTGDWVHVELPDDA